MPPTFEIGMVYRKNSRLHLAVDHHTLITVVRGEFQEVRPYVKYEAIRHISVDELCTRWKVGVEHLDVATKRYLAPPAPSGVARGSRIASLGHKTKPRKAKAKTAAPAVAHEGGAIALASKVREGQPSRPTTAPKKTSKVAS